MVYNCVCVCVCVCLRSLRTLYRVLLLIGDRSFSFSIFASSSSVDQELKKAEPKKSENELHWEELVRNMVRPLNLCDLDFTDLHSDDEKDVLAPRGLGAGIPPPPPPLGAGGMVLPPPMMPPSLVPPPMFGYSGYGAGSLTNSVNSSLNGSINGELANGNNTIKKNKKTVRRERYIDYIEANPISFY